MEYFDQKKVLVTGGSSGIGKEAAKHLAQAGADVCIAARRQEVLDAAVDEIEASKKRPGQIVTSVSVDVTDFDAVKSATDSVLTELGGLDVLVNNAGFALPLPFHELELDDFERSMSVNYMGHVHMTRALLPHFKQQQSGDICNVTSMLGFMGIYGYSAYCGSKYAIVGMTECLRQEMIPHNVRVSLFYPPTTDTPGLEKENEVKPEATWAIEGKSQAFEPEDVSRVMLKGIAKGKFVNMIGLGNWFIYYAQRFAPWLVRWITDSELKKHLRKQD
jgi:NAD(P)-dependent dehydrogenase (short-subunit alcohol dehydrogenase family)